MKVTPHIDTKGLGKRLAKFREMLGMSQNTFAARLEITRVRLATYESGRVPLPWLAYRKIALEFDLNPHWLATGEGNAYAPFDRAQLNAAHPARTPFIEVFAGNRALHGARGSSADSEEQSQLAIALAVLGRALDKFLDLDHTTRLEIQRAIGFSEKVAVLRAMLDVAEGGRERAAEGMSPFGYATKAAGKKESLTQYTNGDTYRDMASTIPDLGSILSQVRKMTAKPGQKAALASRLGISPARLSEWLRDNEDKRLPGAKHTLQLLRFVRGEEIK
jgi:transcriptional regulator with XRE-family HTH domain